ncbi:hypothetical protein GOODEAATRI_013136 [Goodea atripinnis]|uniref:Uncharacterized protein n=1 Tax=Goodea atripinnis TaxID=208336 RepID=A0ABV0MRR3_9TELE
MMLPKYHPPPLLLLQKTAYMIASAVICSVYILCAVVLFCGVREHEATGNRSKPMPFLQGIKMVMGYGPYAKLVMDGEGAALFSCSVPPFDINLRISLQIPDTYSSQPTSQAAALRRGKVQFSATLAIPFWQWFLTRFGKKTAAFVGSMVRPCILSRSGVACKSGDYCRKRHSPVIFFLPVCHSLRDPGGVREEQPHHHLRSFLSMLPDVVDDFQVQNPNSTGHEAIFYSFYVFFTKFASGISLGVSTLRYITSGCSQPEEVDLTLKLLVSAVPVVLIFIGMGILYTYPIDEERRQGNRKILQEMRLGLWG